jgi:hypothetical protein
MARLKYSIEIRQDELSITTQNPSGPSDTQHRFKLITLRIKVEDVAFTSTSSLQIRLAWTSSEFIHFGKSHSLRQNLTDGRTVLHNTLNKKQRKKNPTTERYKKNLVAFSYNTQQDVTRIYNIVRTW